MANFSTYLEDKILDEVLGTTEYTKPTVYAALMSTVPTMPAGTGGVEITTGGATRVQVSGKFAAASAGSAASNAAATFPTATVAYTVAGVALYDAATGGNLLAAGPLTGGSKAVAIGDTFSISAGQLSEAIS